MVTHQLQVRCRPVKVCSSETDVLPLSHPTNNSQQFQVLTSCWAWPVLTEPENPPVCLLLAFYFRSIFYVFALYKCTFTLFYFMQKSQKARCHQWLVRHLTSHLRDQKHRLRDHILVPGPGRLCRVPAFRGNTRRLLGHKGRKTCVLVTGRFCLRTFTVPSMKYTWRVKLMKVLLNARLIIASL